MNLTYEQRVFSWASGHYLGDEVDETFWSLSNEEQLEYLEENAWEPFENYAGQDIYQWINQLANDIIMKRVPEEEEE